MAIHTSFKRLLMFLGSLLSLVCLVHLYLNVLLARHQSSDSLVAFAKTTHRRDLLFSNRTKPSFKRTIKELDGIKIRRSLKKSEAKLVGCPQVLYTPPAPEVLTETFEWQAVDADSVCFVFSAYYESRTEAHVIKIIGISTEDNYRKFCQLWYVSKILPEIVEAEVVMLPESHDRRFSAAFILCYVPQHLQVPYAVSVVGSACERPLNVLKVVNNQPEASYEVNFTVCITPLNFRFNNSEQLVEIIEVNRIFGAERFVLYNYTTGLNVDRYLQSYETDEIVSVIPWKIPVVVDVWPPDPQVIPEIHYFGQVAALNDCLYRNMLRSRFIVFTDLDEVIVPRAHDTWIDMMAEVTDDWSQTLSTLGNREMFPGSYLVQNTFFRLDWGDELSSEAVRGEREWKLMTLRKLRRESMVYQWYVRSKYIVWSKMAEIVTVHSVFQYINDWNVTCVRVKKQHALVHHYREWDGDGSISLVSSVVDDRMRHFAGKIVANVSLRHRKVTPRKELFSVNHL